MTPSYGFADGKSTGFSRCSGAQKRLYYRWQGLAQGALFG